MWRLPSYLDYRMTTAFDESNSEWRHQRIKASCERYIYFSSENLNQNNSKIRRKPRMACLVWQIFKIIKSKSGCQEPSSLWRVIQEDKLKCARSMREVSNWLSLMMISTVNSLWLFYDRSLHYVSNHCCRSIGAQKLRVSWLEEIHKNHQIVLPHAVLL